MNFALNISQKVEKYLQEMVDAKMAAEGTDLIDEQEEEEMYQLALARVLEENPLAQAAGNIRMGEYILIVDSDTRVVSSFSSPFFFSFAASVPLANIASPSTVSSTAPPRCSSLPKSPSSNIPPV